MSKIKIGERIFEVRELLYKDLAELGDIEKKEMVKKLLFLSTDITEEEYNTLSIKNGIVLQKAVNELNGLNKDDFQNPTQTTTA